MRILMTTDPVGGVWTYSLTLARALTERGVEVALAVEGGTPSDDQWDQLRSVGLYECSVFDRKVEWMPQPWEDVAATGEGLLELATRVRPDLVHLNSYSHAALSWRVPVLVVAHSCVLTWWKAVKGDDAPPEWAKYRSSVRCGLHAATEVVAPTRAFLMEIRRVYGLGPRGRVISNAVAGTNAANVGRPIVLTAGRLWDEGKNLAAVEAVARHLPWPVVVVGDTGSRDAAHVRRVGRLPAGELAAWMHRSAIYCAPARYEPFGLTALEAGAAGCALVLGDIPTLREVWEDAALFVDPGDENALREALTHLIEDESRRRGLGRRARERASFFGIDSMASRYVEAYVGVVAGHVATAQGAAIE